jgi:hypothetical protein
MDKEGRKQMSDTYAKRTCPFCGEEFTQSYTEYMKHTITCNHHRKSVVTVLYSQQTKSEKP